MTPPGTKGQPAGPQPGPEAGPGQGPRGEDAEAAQAPAETRQHVYRRVAEGPFADVLPGRALRRGRYTMRDQLVDLRAVPQRPRKVFNLRHLFALAKRLFDLFSNRPTRFGRFLSRVNPYPHPFRRVTIRSFDGTRISGWLGLQPSRRPAVLIVPGMFSSKDDTAQRNKALKIWRRWNYNVLVMDMRGFGQSEQAPSTPGWKEAEDVLAAARFLYAFNTVDRVAIVAESLGATAAILAAAQEGIWEEEAEQEATGKAVALPPEGPDVQRPGRQGEAVGLRDVTPTEAPRGPPRSQEPPRAARQETEAGPDSAAGTPASGAVGVRRGPAPRRVISAVFAISPFAESRPAVAHLDRIPPRTLRFQHSVHRIFRRLLRASTQGRHASFLEFMEDSARHYGVTTDELYARSDLTRTIAHIRAPTLILHAEDDDLVPLVHADHLTRLVADRDDVAVWTLRWGRHVEFDVLDRRWYWRIMSRFMGQWVGR